MQPFSLLFAVVASLGIAQVFGFDITRNDNLAVYWGQDSAGNQGSLSSYCQDDTIDNIVMAFLYVFFGPADTLSQPEIDFANTCNQFDFSTFPGTDLADCSFMASQIEACQAKGKIVTLSLGGATGQVGFSSDSAAESLAKRVWNEFLGGSSSTRPFGSAVLDGLDLDIESGSSAHYDTFVNTIRSLSAGASKRYYITAAPQCPFPDEWIQPALDASLFDAVFVQFYNNFCELSEPNNYNFDTWASWAKSGSDNKDIKIFIGAPASSNAAGTGYVGPNTLGNFATDAQDSSSSMGGVMLWDASEAVKNGNYHQKIKSILTANGNGPKKPSNSTISATASKPTATTKSKSGSSLGSDSTEGSSSGKTATKASTSAESKDENAASRINSRFFRARD
ncbi:glycoside hydrolase family 18 protein [Peniophora sp. CONT]|nr:glycoside hydrolase family 18 protein [Peniophora sp. CONT]